jgi:HlyD family secretion protein
MTRRSLFLFMGVLLAALLFAWLAWWGLRPAEATSIVASKAPLVRTL